MISAQKGLNEPRYASLKGIMAAKKKPIEAQGRGRRSASTAEDLAPKTQVVAPGAAAARGRR